MVRPFNIMAKPVSGVCNLDCRYCYYSHKPQDIYAGAEKFLMADDILASYTRQYMEAMPEHCEFSWQGGEPLLAGKDFYQKALAFQKQFARPNQVVANALQTNATLLDDQWCEFFREHNFLIGVSLDGPQRVHDRFRMDQDGNPTWHRAMAGLDLLAKHRVEFNILATLNSANAGLGGDLYRFFVNRGVRYLQFIPVLERQADGLPTLHSCTAAQYGRFLIETWDQWLSRDIGKVSERFIDSALHVLVHGQASICCYARQCANAHVLEFNGDLYACDHFVFERWRLGNIMDSQLAELIQGKRLEEFAQLKQATPDACRQCEYLPLCNGGCPKHHFPIGADPARVNHFCQSYKTFFKHALGDLERTADYIRRGQMPPCPKTKVGPAKAPGAQSPALASVSATAARGAKPPGRNAPCFCGSGLKYKNCCGRK
jgi:uncharacterized protein